MDILIWISKAASLVKSIFALGDSKQQQALRDEVATLREEKLELEKRLAETTRFDDQRDQYVMTTLSTGATVYILKGSGEREPAVQPPHQDPAQGKDKSAVYFCANCFHQRRHAILQPTKVDFNRDTYTCPACAMTRLIPNNRPAEVYRIPRRTRFDGF